MSRGLQAGEDDTRTLTDLLVSQVSICMSSKLSVCESDRQTDKQTHKLTNCRLHSHLFFSSLIIPFHSSSLISHTTWFLYRPLSMIYYSGQSVLSFYSDSPMIFKVATLLASSSISEHISCLVLKPTFLTALLHFSLSVLHFL